MVNPRFLLDTNVLSEAVRPMPSDFVVAKIREHVAEIAVPSPVWHELLFGCRRLPSGRRRTALEAYLDQGIRSTFRILPYDEAAATWHAEERNRLLASGRTPPFVDGQIAAIAATQRLVLVTANGADFEHFRDIDVADWTRPASAG